MARAFLTVPDDVLEHADWAADYFEERGFSLKLEHRLAAYPYRPTLHCKRDQMTLVVEVVEQVSLDRVKEWARYGKSTARDTRVAFAVPREERPGTSDENAMAELGVGLYLVSSDDVREALAPKDLALNLEPPELRRLPNRVRRLLGPAYDQLDRSQWREAFEEICQVLENASRLHLRKAVRTGRVTLRRPNGRQWNLSEAQIEKMTMGRLAEAYASIQNPNHADTVAGHALSTINKDRVGVVHRKSRASTEGRLRKNVGQHIWLMINALREIT